MTVEKALTADVGAPGARLHTGRSRNDQVATDTRLHAKALLDMLMRQNCALRRTILRAARKNVGVVMPGYTHMQHAQPVLFSHHLLAYFWMFTRDFKRLRDAFAAADANPPGLGGAGGHHLRHRPHPHDRASGLRPCDPQLDGRGIRP
ncbi:lyase family protein [Atopobiaceae bacterium LCP21S3_F11]